MGTMESKAALQINKRLETTMQTTESLTNSLAKQLGVDPSTISTLAGMAAGFLEDAYGSREQAAEALQADQSLASPATMHAMDTHKRLLVRSHMKPQELTATVYDLVAA